MDNQGETNTGDSLYPSKPRDNPESGQQQLGQPAEANHAELLEVFWRGRWIVITAVVVAIGAAILYLQSTTPLYASSSSIYVFQNARTIAPDGSTVQAPQDIYYLQTQSEILKSSSILNIAADRLRTRNVRFFSSSDSPVTLLKLGLAVELGKSSDIITVTFESPSPEDSAEAVNAIVDAYQTYTSDERKSTAGEIFKVLQGELRQREQERNDKLQKMQQFLADHSDVDVNDADRRQNSEVSQLYGINNALTPAQLEEAEARARYLMAKNDASDPIKLRELMATGLPPGSSLQGTESPEEQQLRSYWNSLQAQLADMQTKLGSQHPDVLRVKAAISRVEAQLTDLGVNPARGDPINGVTNSEKQTAEIFIGSALQRWQLAQTKVQSLNESYAKTYDEDRQRAAKANDTAAGYQLLQEDYKQSVLSCQAIDNRMKELNLTKDTGGLTNVSILEVGKPSMVPSKPQRAKTIGIALMLGLGLGMGLAFLNGWMDQRFRSAEDVSSSLNLAILGALPQISGREAINVRGQKSHLMPVSDYAEACRAIRTAIYFGMPDSQAKTLLVTSPLPGDGKSTVVSNLAIVMAQAGQKTVVLDADYRRPNQHRIFEQPNLIGSTNVLNGTATLAEAIKQTGIKGVDLLPCGPTPSHPAELLNSQSFADLLQELSKRYDHVVVDSPPVMPVTDARILGAVCDATVFVVRAEKSTRKVSLFARDVLQSVGTNILGVAINGLSRTRGYYDAGYYQYGYGGKGSATRKGNAVPVEGASEPMLTPEPGRDDPAATHEDSSTI